MEKKDYYTLKEIMLGLKAECLLQEEKLQELKKYCMKDENRAIDYHFFASHNYEGIPELDCRVKLVLGILDTLQEKIKKCITGMDGTLANVSLLEKKADGYHFWKNRISIYPIYIIDRKEFSNLADTILESDYSKYMNTIYASIDSIEMHSCVDLTLYPKWVSMSFYEGPIMPKSDLSYSFLDDTLGFSSRNKYQWLDIEQLKLVLNMKVPCNKLNEYQCEVISNSEEAKKDIIVESFEPNLSHKFVMEDEGKQYILRRVGKK